ncbi:MAG TPA: threonine/serine dehydratase [Nocardioidaceae bacterium]|nr:threonine/serine dehydratase [Nocardioidaceae bacterium]
MTVDTTLVGLADVQAAAGRIGTTCVRTPLLAAGPDDDVLGLRVKPESLQATGAFKLRGATNAIALLDDDARRAGVVTHSSGNHGQAVAYAARAAGVACTVVIPDNAAALKIAATKRWGARVLTVPVAERETAANAIVEETGAALIPPYDDARVIAGQGTVGLEIAAGATDLDTVLVPVSGGGLIAGVATAIKALSPKTRVIGVEPELAGDLAEGFAAGRHVAWPVELTARTIADGLRIETVGDLPWAHIQAYVDDVVTVSESAITDAMRLLARRSRLVVEPSGAVATAGWMTHPDPASLGRSVAIVSGGNVDPAVFAEVIAT